MAQRIASVGLRTGLANQSVSHKHVCGTKGIERKGKHTNCLSPPSVTHPHCLSLYPLSLSLTPSLPQHHSLPSAPFFIECTSSSISVTLCSCTGQGGNKGKCSERVEVVGLKESDGCDERRAAVPSPPLLPRPICFSSSSREAHVSASSLASATATAAAAAALCL